MHTFILKVYKNRLIKKNNTTNELETGWDSSKTKKILKTSKMKVLHTVAGKMLLDIESSGGTYK